MAAQSNKNRARERAAQARIAQQAAARRRRTMISAGAGVLVLAIIAVIVIAASVGGNSKSPTNSASTANLGPEGMAIEQGTALASNASAATGKTIDGIHCDSSEQVAYHIHAHLAVYVDGKLRPIPLGIGTVEPSVQQTSTGGFASATKCYYWLHTHVQDGVIHIESPTQKVYTLGQFFDEWQQPLSSGQVATSKGVVTAYLNGKPYTGDPKAIPLTAHANIQLDVGSPTVAPQTVDWSHSTL